jgi:hypothetical protein
MALARSPNRSARDARLLLATIAVSVIALLLLAQYRFPERGELIELPPPPIERLAARATYDELSRIVGSLESRVSPALVVLQVGSTPAPRPYSVHDVIHTQSLRSDLPTFAPAVRLQHDLALALLPQGTGVQGIVGEPEAVPVVLASDPVLGLAVVRVPPPPETAWRREIATEIQTPKYAVVVEGSRRGPTLRPLFMARSDRFTDPAWPDPLLVLGTAGFASEGALIFSLDGRFLGMAVVGQGLSALVPSDSLMAMGEQLVSGGTRQVADIGVQLQPLTATLSAATGAAHGTIVTHVAASGPAAGVLQIGDVVEAMGGQPIVSPEGLLLRIAREQPGSEAALRVRRDGELIDVTVTTRAFDTASAPAADGLGLELRTVRDVGAEVIQVTADSAAALAGLQRGDVVTHLQAASAPTAAEITRAFASAQPGSFVIVGVERASRHMVLAIRKP